MSAVEQTIIDAVDEGFDRQLAFTAELVRFPSLRGNELPIQDFVFGALAARGLALDRWQLREADMAHHPGRSPVAVSYEQATNVVGTFRPPVERGRSLILNAHVDVVPTGPRDMWSDDPFSATIRDGWMYGRGAADMKAGLAANIFAFDALRRAGLRPAATIHFESVVEEESTGNGTLSTSLRGYRAQAALTPEPEDEMLVRANTGVVWFKVEVRGHPAHTRDMASGSNAIDAAFRLIAALRALEAECNRQHERHRYFEHLDHPLNLNIGRIEGGDSASSVPAWCSFEARFAMYPGVSAEAVRHAVETCLAQASARDPTLANRPPAVTWHGFTCEGYVLAPGSEAEAALARSHQRVFGRPLESFTTPGYLDARVHVLYDRIPSLVYGPVSRHIHGCDECVHLESLRRVTKTIALFLADWCGVEHEHD